MKSMDIHRTKSYSMSDRKEEYKLISNTDLEEIDEENNNIEGFKTQTIDTIQSGTIDLIENKTSDLANRNVKREEAEKMREAGTLTSTENSGSNFIETERMTEDELFDISEDLRSTALRHADSEVTRLD